MSQGQPGELSEYILFKEICAENGVDSMNQKHNRKVAIIVFACALLLICAGFFSLYLLIQRAQNEQFFYEESISHADYKGNEFYVTVGVSKSWTNDDGTVGAQYDGVITNCSNINFSDWVVTIQVPEDAVIDSDWNGVYTQEGTTITITSVDYNTVITPEKAETFGFVMITDEAFQVEELTVSAYKNYTWNDFVFCRILLIASGVFLLALIIYIIIQMRVHQFRVRQKKDAEIITQSLKTFANFVDAKDPYTHGHSARVALYAREIARRIGLPEADQMRLYYIALIHDVGKIGMPENILKKPGELSDEESAIMQRHTINGADMLRDFTAITGIAGGAMYHHERFDGKGYPTQLAGDHIPLFARIIAIADAYDAMSSDRCYRPRMKKTAILKELRENSGTQFDPQLVSHMIDMMNDGFTAEVQEKNH
jgi:HD-GYP domain-containing protein (c-di-GMP phosphodiesterase class II)